MSSKLKKKPIIVFIVLLLFVTLLIGAIIFANKYFSPKKSLERMFYLRADMKLEEYYNCFDIPEFSKNPANTLESYLAFAKEKDFQKIDSFKIKEIYKDTFQVKYGDTTEELTLVKQTKKALGYFDTYKIQIESVTSPLLYIITPIGSKLNIDGKDIDPSLKVKESDINQKYDELAEEETLGTDLVKGLKSISTRSHPIDYYEYYDERYEHYCFVNAFNKNYAITLTTDYSEPYITTITPTDDIHLLRDVVLREQDEKEIKQLAERFAQEFYYSMQDKEEFDILTPYVSNNAEMLDNLRSSYDELKDLFIHDTADVGYFDLYFNEFITNVHNPNLLDINQNEYTAIVDISYSYTSREYDGFTDSYDDYTHELSDMSIRIKCIKENGKWVVSGAENLDMIF